jgi:hypothetical protein
MDLAAPIDYLRARQQTAVFSALRLCSLFVQEITRRGLPSITRAFEHHLCLTKSEIEQPAIPQPGGSFDERTRVRMAISREKLANFPSGSAILALKATTMISDCAN